MTASLHDLKGQLRAIRRRQRRRHRLWKRLVSVDIETFDERGILLLRTPSAELFRQVLELNARLGIAENQPDRTESRRAARRRRKGLPPPKPQHVTFQDGTATGRFTNHPRIVHGQ